MVLSSWFLHFLFLAFPLFLLSSDCEDWSAFTSVETVGVEEVLVEEIYDLVGLAIDEGWIIPTT